MKTISIFNYSFTSEWDVNYDEFEETIEIIKNTIIETSEVIDLPKFTTEYLLFCSYDEENTYGSIIFNYVVTIIVFYSEIIDVKHLTAWYKSPIEFLRTGSLSMNNIFNPDKNVYYQHNNNYVILQ